MTSTTSEPDSADARPVRSQIADGIATVWLHRPERRNALNSELMAALPEVVTAAAQREDVQVIVVTGSDPAFCAGLDLNELGSTAGNLKLPDDDPVETWPWNSGGKPVIGAINGAAVTGGLEVALRCDIRIASDRARFADTHARVGQIPGAGLSVRLPRLIGQARAREMSFTGNFVNAETALQWGLVNHVVPHEQLLDAAYALAREIANNDPEAVLAMSRLYDATENLPIRDALELEAKTALEWQAAHQDRSVVAARRADVTARGHEQIRKVAN